MADATDRTHRVPGEGRFRWLVIAVPYLWLALFFLVPFAIVLRISLSEVAIAQPPYAPVFDWSRPAELLDAVRQLSLENYAWLAGDPLYLDAYLSSLWIAAVSTAIALLIGFPFAYGLSRAPTKWRGLLLMLTILPFWTSFLIRVYAWIGILKGDGLVNQLLLGLGLIDAPLQLLNTEFSVHVGIVYCYLPFMVLPIYASLERMDERLLEAAGDLGCPPFKAFWSITVPLAMPGVLAGVLLVFIPAVGEFVIPDLLGGSGTLMIGKTLWSEFFSNRDWPVSSAVAILLLLLLVAPIALFQRAQARAAGNA
ncbi:ABC transporter permease subunit [Aurantimonas sp. Leaf443]|uniref:ABC transporter permease subunit n=1 Tax=Aurantimonas sp. Leaf443 TaxID=1736378 RepID=UPI0007017121|nr:ABC transporter permease subunit [Aurantimonas sp. Leaf443]KQT87931.1 putrescine/spermidine ABC transporter permease [Aurantimonas sp. Leaf443]